MMPLSVDLTHETADAAATLVMFIYMAFVGEICGNPMGPYTCSLWLHLDFSFAKLGSMVLAMGPCVFLRLTKQLTNAMAHPSTTS